MTVIVLSACPPGLRGDLTRWMMEVSPGVFVGNVSARIRERLWHRIVEALVRGRALMIHSARNEQRLAFKVHGHEWLPVDYDGLELMMRPAKGAGVVYSGPTSTDDDSPHSSPPERWSTAARRRRLRSDIERHTRPN